MITHERPRHEVAFTANRFKGLRTRMRAFSDLQRAPTKKRPRE